MHTGWRGTAVVALLLVGLAGGYGGALALARPPVESGVAQPVAASSPSIPVDPAAPVKQDPAIDPLPTDLEMLRTRFRDRGFSFSYPRPKGWEVTRVLDDEKWRDPSITVAYTYLLRVRSTRGRNESIARTLEDRKRDLDADQQDVEWHGETADFLSFSYLDEGHRRYGLLQWLDLGSGFADVEVAVTGRAVDQEGLRSLLDTVVSGVRGVDP